MLAQISCRNSVFPFPFSISSGKVLGSSVLTRSLQPWDGEQEFLGRSLSGLSSSLTPKVYSALSEEMTGETKNRGPEDINQSAARSHGWRAADAQGTSSEMFEMNFQVCIFQTMFRSSLLSFRPSLKPTESTEMRAEGKRHARSNFSDFGECLDFSSESKVRVLKYVPYCIALAWLSQGAAPKELLPPNISNPASHSVSLSVSHSTLLFLPSASPHSLLTTTVSRHSFIDHLAFHPP